MKRMAVSTIKGQTARLLVKGVDYTVTFSTGVHDSEDYPITVYDCGAFYHVKMTLLGIPAMGKGQALNPALTIQLPHPTLAYFGVTHAVGDLDFLFFFQFGSSGKLVITNRSGVATGGERGIQITAFLAKA